MDIAAIGVAVGVAVTASSGVGAVALYVIRSEIKGEVTRVDGRINTHEAGCDVRQRALAETLTEIKQQGHRLEDKIDRLVGA